MNTTIQLEIERDGCAQQVEFVGCWLLESDPDYTVTDAPGREGMFYGVALTRRGSLAVVSESVSGALEPQLKMYPNFEAAEADGVPGDILAKAWEAKEAIAARQ